jgi:hypothetical protein
MDVPQVQMVEKVLDVPVVHTPEQIIEVPKIQVDQKAVVGKLVERKRLQVRRDLLTARSADWSTQIARWQKWRKWRMQVKQQNLRSGRRSRVEDLF